MNENGTFRGDEAFDVRHYLPNLLEQVAQSVGVEFQNFCKRKYGLLRTDWTVLSYLGTHGRSSAKQISQATQTHKTKISRSVSRLASNRYLIRERSESDRRWEFLELTPAGRVLFDDLVEHAKGYEAKLLSQLSEAECMYLRNILQKLLPPA